MENIDRSVLFIDGVDDPVLRAAADTKEVGAVGRAREREIGRGEGRLAEIDREDVAEPIDLLDGEFFAVIAKVDGELIDVALRDRVDADAECHTNLALGTPIDVQEALLEYLRVVVDG